MGAVGRTALAALQAALIALALGAVLLVPALIHLFGVFKGSRAATWPDPRHGGAILSSAGLP